MKNIVLCGFMGCGKSTVGKLLAQKLNMTFVDMDSYIEEQACKTVSDIFAEDGEAAFRRMEHDACVALGKADNLVIATGGGAVLREDNCEALKANGTIVWLNVTAQTVLTRLQNDTTRPLLQRPDKEQAVNDLLAARTPLYERAADICAEADCDAQDVVRTIHTLLFF